MGSYWSNSIIACKKLLIEITDKKKNMPLWLMKYVFLSLFDCLSPSYRLQAKVKYHGKKELCSKSLWSVIVSSPHFWPKETKCYDIVYIWMFSVCFVCCFLAHDIVLISLRFWRKRSSIPDLNTFHFSLWTWPFAFIVPSAFPPLCGFGHESFQDSVDTIVGDFKTWLACFNPIHFKTWKPALNILSLLIQANQK